LQAWKGFESLGVEYQLSRYIVRKAVELKIHRESQVV